jgi:DNA-binding CsgD family transcriptional regulator/tetratricopeptide (TPR) repeat protein
MAGSAGFVGRARELSCLRAALGGDARLLLVAGDAGVGKTRFTRETMRLAAASGMVALWGACLPLAGKLPLLPVAGALGELRRLDEGRVLHAALDACPPFVRGEIERLLPQLSAATADAPAAGEGLRERLFAAVAELLGAVAQRSPAALVIEDVHWADSATLDLLMFVTRAGGEGAVTVVVTCRSDEPFLDAHVADWLAHARGSRSAEEIRLGPLSRDEAAAQVAGLLGGPPPPGLVDALYGRTGGNPFFTEQLVAAAQAGPGEDVVRVPAGLPARLAGLLAARAGRCGGDAQAVLAVLAVAGRPLTEDLLGEVTGLDLATMRAGLRELAAAQLLADTGTDGGQRPRHALLAEAVAAGLLPGERVALHERTARVLAAGHGDTLAAEIAGHWAAAGRAAEELPARVAAATAAERVFGYAEAAAHCQRAIDLCHQVPGAAAGLDLPRLYVRAIDALNTSGGSDRARELAGEAYRRFATHPDPATAAVIHLRAGYFRGLTAPADGLPLITEALRLFEQAPPSADQAEAWLHYATIFLFMAEGQLDASRAALHRSLEIAQAAGATALIPRILAWLAIHAGLRGQAAEGFALLRRARAAADASGGDTVLWVDALESNALLGTGNSQSAADVAARGLQTARRAGRHGSYQASALASTAAEALLAMGRTAEAAALIEPLTADPPDRDHWPVHQIRAEIDLLRGDTQAAQRRQRQISALLSGYFMIDAAREAGTRAAELALWAGRPGDALDDINRVLALYEVPDLSVFCGRLLTAGMRACADLAERARARRDQDAADAALSAAGQLASWVNRMAGIPFADHPPIATIPAERATWDAERTRLAGVSDPAAWQVAAQAWQDLGWPHRAAYAWWRRAEALLSAGRPRPAAAALQAAATAADGHAPLLAEIRALAQRARIPLPTSPATPAGPPHHPVADAPYRLTEREMAVLRLLADGYTNAQIGAALFISPKTASVHVTSILRKLGVAGRVQAAAMAERAGLLQDRGPRD